MIEYFYQSLVAIGYHHPFHPALTHLPVGMVMGGFLFAVVAMVFRKAALFRTSRHCFILALISLLPVVAVGYMDWQHFYGGAWLFPIQMKLILAAVLLFFLAVAMVAGAREEMASAKTVLIYAVCFLCVVGLGYFGGELVFGKKAAAPGEGEKPLGELAQKGEAAFSELGCTACHFTDSTAVKVGPGLKSLFQQEKFPSSGWPATEESFRRQLSTPYQSMPPFAWLSGEKVEALIAYLKTR